MVFWLSTPSPQPPPPPQKYDLAGTPLAEVACDHLPDLERCRREVAAAATHLMTAELQMPHCGGEWPGSLGGCVPGGGRGCE